ncbi:sulfite exporter TauE/SafE family protein [Ponticoccus sp. SC2-23]|uniref:sulfite exporter TauE/SafE family protein n=1 Tax=Alexandriicola marinus TaxID=2081710 RepID=UPI0013DEF453|nr:sulfite exporter TauE/SafE family protein [Alexandriicola marinus]MBM1220863.1 sulfite exporter TauE/SafE family protein [Ponticoccus sp. SC6-9]MBM1225433.1 sulfite exporter TauE/SafE family protein [Ponticoccus sp. SC6-15]MBM1227616.1 sulfite exporter TauE/SafE family protein [Ponticoccus sp. SC6-38]MBM1234746.1 sulfite exporter TauE/SafE family protein [Ponticoccus sp. SC6-45]MBM1238118.1 sulfite exporter TauE/SafE family protein [Ponticoccus sp. SC6-49]MBM1244249.1 sulfite exporter TauE
MSDRTSSLLDPQQMLDEAWSARLDSRQFRTRSAIAVSASLTGIWLIAMISFDLWDRVIGLWPATITMVFGSLVAGSTPQGGGVVAFPVFTKVFGMPPEVARTFSFCIQSVGMMAATAWIVINRRPVEWRTLAIVTASAVAGLAVAGILSAQSDLPFRPAALSAPYVKITFTIVLIAMAFVVYEGTRVSIREVHLGLPGLNGRMRATLVLCGFLGGVSSALVGSGADVFLYLALVLFFAVDPKVGVPTSVICMALISVIGMVYFGLVDGQLLVGLNDAGQVVSVGGDPVGLNEAGRLIYGEGAPAPARQYDVLGLWLAAIPVVVWGAPVGTWIAARLTTRNLVRFVTILALSEVISTAIFLKPLRTDMFLLSYFIIGVVLTVLVLRVVANRREQIFNLPEANLEASLHADRLDIGEGFRREGGTR